MSFTCGTCHVAQPSGTKPVPKVYVRVKHYEFPISDPSEIPMGKGFGFNENGEMVVSVFGNETQKVVLECGACSGVVQGKPVALDMRLYIAMANTLTAPKAHGKACKKLIDDCKVCRGMIAHMKTFPLMGLAKVTENPQAREFRTPLKALAIWGLIERQSHNSKRASRDFTNGFEMMKALNIKIKEA
jgi:hypothetical protein